MNEYYHSLLMLARTVIGYTLGIGDLRLYEELQAEGDPFFTQKKGVFVTLTTKAGALRGCIGNLIGYQSVVDQVARLAHEAAFNDPRFEAVTKEELEDLVIEISLLSEAKPISSPREIRLGIDGIILIHHTQRAVFLPHVALEQGWDLETTLKRLSNKAGLREDGWADSLTTFEVFQSTSFNEEQL